MKNGTVRFGYYQYAFLGSESQWAAEASECASEQGKFWEYHDLLFARQAGENRGAFAKDKLKQFAVELKLASAEFDACLDSGKYAEQIDKDRAFAKSLEVEGTPSFAINGGLVSGAQPFDFLQSVIESAKKAKS